MGKVYLVAERTSEDLKAGQVYWHSIKAFNNKEDAIEYIYFFEAELVEGLDGVYLFKDKNNNYRYYYLKETNVRGAEDERETTK